MLILARKEGEKIKIGDDIFIEIISVKSGLVKIGLEAPPNVSILRGELYESIKDENVIASSVNKTVVDEIGEFFKERQKTVNINKAKIKGDNFFE